MKIVLTTRATDFGRTMAADHTMRVSSSPSIQQLQQRCTQTAGKMAVSALWRLLRRVLRAVASLSTTSAAVLQQLASLLVLPHCMGSHSEAATQLGTLTGVPLPEGPAVRLAPRQCAAGKLGGFSSAASRHRPPISIIAGRTQICGSSCRVNGKVGGSAQQPRWYSEVVPSWQWQYRQQPLPLPPAAPLLSRRPFTVVLDLDETLVWTQRPGLSCCTTPAGCERPDAQCVLGAFTVQCEVASGQWGPLVVVPRPGLRQFLRSAASVAELVVFTASVPGYAGPILDAVDPNGSLFAARLFRDSTTTTSAGLSHVKDLSRLGRDLARTIIIDNEPRSFILQPANGVPIPAFKGEPEDGQLLAVAAPLVAQLAAQGDVRPTLERHFRMAAWFQRRLRARSV